VIFAYVIFAYVIFAYMVKSVRKMLY